MSNLYRLIVCSFLFGLLSPASAQVVNDSIANRLELILNRPLRSSTAYSTVEETCVDEQLTGKCIEYHNDQWFYFTAADIPNHYITISRQDCREVRGVQLVLLTGEPCLPETYQVLACVSLASQEDIYLKAETLETGRTYLLNIDGYLHDFCSFTIAYSSTPGGLNTRQALRPFQEIRQQEGKVSFSWQTPANLLDETVQYELHRRETAEKKFEQVQTKNHERNAYGKNRESYSTTDSLPGTGTYFYKLVARLNTGEGIVLSEAQVKQKERAKSREVLEISLPAAKKTPYTLLIFDAEKQSLLETKKGTTSTKQQSLQYNVSRWQKQGVRLFRVVFINDHNGEQKEWLFSH